MLSQTIGERTAFLNSLGQDDLRIIDREWDGWAHAQQRPPDGDWLTWLVLGGRGAGKTRAGAEWLARRADRSGARLALIGATLHDVREVMIEGESGLRAIAPGWRRPVYEPSRRRLVWPNGAVAHAFSAEDSDSLRGPQFHAAWADEFCAWRDPDTVLSMLRLGLRLGNDPRLVVTTTPNAQPPLAVLMAEASTRVTRAGTRINSRNLSGNFLHELNRLYGGTRLEKQELLGEILTDDDALWKEATIVACRAAAPMRFDQVVVGLDPTTSAAGDACGIVVVGSVGDRAYVLADRTVKGRDPAGWAEAVARAVAEHEADWVIAETNQGGEMVETLLNMARCGARVKSVKATRSKWARAEPVAALYEQGRVIHCAAMPELEDEMRGFAASGGPSPDRVDALVWAVTHLLLKREPPVPRARFG